MSMQRFKNLKTLQDIRLEKARLKYEMLVAENRLNENLGAIEKLFTITSVFRRFMDGLNYARHIYENVRYYIRKFTGGSSTDDSPPKEGKE